MTSLPKTAVHGRYALRLIVVGDRYAQWEITRDGVIVGKMHDGRAYGWGRPHSSMRELVWAGPFPPDASSPKSPHYGMLFDLGPLDESGDSVYQAALERFAEHAERLVKWRHANR